jgi:EmrB/QacA subfamily drug resistance transporter
VTKRAINPWIILVILAMGLFMTLLDLTIVNIAIPSIVDGVHATLDQVLWMLNGYSLGYSVLLITSGRLGDIVGPRRLFIGGMLWFTAASVFSGLAQNPDMLIAGRALQGVGAALLAPQTMAILLTVFPVERRAPMFAVYGVLGGLAVATGPTLGGLLTTYVGWRWIFFVNVPIGIAVAVAALRLVPDIRPGRRHRLDLPGVALVSGALFCLVFGLIEGQRYSWGTVAGFLSIPLILGVGAALIVAFIAYQATRQKGEPLLPFEVFKDRNFTLMTLVLCTMGFAIVGLFLPLTIYYQSVLGLSAIAAGLTIVVMPGAMFFTTGFANGPVGQKMDPKFFLMPGLLLLAAGVSFIAWSAQADSSRWAFVPGLVASGLGMGFIFGPVFRVATRDLKPHLAGVASGVIATLQEMGAVIGSAGVGALLQNRLALALHNSAVTAAAQMPAQYRSGFVSSFSNAASQGLEVGVGQTGSSFTPPPGISASAVQQIQALSHSVFGNAFVDAMKPTLILPIAVLVVAALATTAVRRRRVLRPQAEGAELAVGGAGGIWGEASPSVDQPRSVSIPTE